MDLLVLAGGMGSRFGGLKQIEPIDEDNNFIIDYSVYDAIRAGFDRVIFIIKKENYEIFSSTIGKRLSNVIPVEYAFQDIDMVPKGFDYSFRTKPWGTAHAIYCAKDIIADKFAVINADDFYGYESFKLIADFLKNSNYEQFISAGFYVRNTLSPKGAVKRGLFTVEGNVAKNLIESEVKIEQDKMIATPLGKNEWKEISADTLASMTMFGFSKKLIERVEDDYINFFTRPKQELEKVEFLLPDVVNDMVKDNSITLYVNTTTAKWYGITYREDLEDFKQAIQDMKNKGVYPKHLY